MLHCAESASTLNFAASAKKIENNAKVGHGPPWPSKSTPPLPHSPTHNLTPLTGWWVGGG